MHAQTVLQVTQRKDVPIPIGFSVSGNVAKGIKLKQFSELLSAAMNFVISVVGSDVKLLSLGDEVAGTTGIYLSYQLVRCSRPF